MTPGQKVRTPDGRTGTVVENLPLVNHREGAVWVEVHQASNVNSLELFKADLLEVIP